MGRAQGDYTPPKTIQESAIFEDKSMFVEWHTFPPPLAAGHLLEFHYFQSHKSFYV
jgi:hypothetical protein